MKTENLNILNIFNNIYYKNVMYFIIFKVEFSMHNFSSFHS